MKKKNIFLFGKERLILSILEEGTTIQEEQFILQKVILDVVGRELGHALYDMANIDVMEGGAHRIDQCYSKRPRLSEG